jgi:hypothetical protein
MQYSTFSEAAINPVQRWFQFPSYPLTVLRKFGNIDAKTGNGSIPKRCSHTCIREVAIWIPRWYPHQYSLWYFQLREDLGVEGRIILKSVPNEWFCVDSFHPSHNMVQWEGAVVNTAIYIWVQWISRVSSVSEQLLYAIMTQFLKLVTFVYIFI